MISCRSATCLATASGSSPLWKGSTTRYASDNPRATGAIWPDAPGPPCNTMTGGPERPYSRTKSIEHRCARRQIVGRNRFIAPPWGRSATGRFARSPPLDGAMRFAYCALPASIPRIPRRPRERDRVAHVGQPRDIGERALEPQAEARVGHGAVAAEIAVPGVVLLVDAALRHAGVQHIEPLLALAAADDLADPGRQHVHGGDRAAVVVDAHVERLDVLGIVHHDHRFLRVLLCGIALVPRLHVDA